MIQDHKAVKGLESGYDTDGSVDDADQQREPKDYVSYGDVKWTSTGYESELEEDVCEAETVIEGALDLYLGRSGW